MNAPASLRVRGPMTRASRTEERGVPTPERWPPWVTLAVLAMLATAGVLSVGAVRRPWRAPAFHRRDFGFFAVQYAHLLDVPAYDHVALSPNGNDAFGFHGIDGFPTVHDELHASPVKYLLALLYAGTGSLLAVHAAFAAWSALALGYVVRRARVVGWPPHLALVVLGLLALTPPFVAGTTFDLRPFIGIGGFVAALAMALVSRAPPRHLLVIATLGLACREDAAPILAIAAAYLALDARPREARALYLGVVAYVLIFHAVYLAWMPFEYLGGVEALGSLGTLGGYPLVHVLARVPALWSPLTTSFTRHRALAVVTLGLPFFAMAVRQMLDDGFPHHAYLASGRWYAAWAVLVPAVAGTVVARADERGQRPLALLGAGLAAVGLAGSAFQLHQWRLQAESTRGFWEIADRLPREVPLVTDYAHYQAFAEHERVLVWDRFPAYLEPSDARDHPDQIPRLLRAEKLDLMQVHNLLDWKAHLATLRAWKAEGRIRYLGVILYDADKIEAAATTGRRGDCSDDGFITAALAR